MTFNFLTSMGRRTRRLNNPAHPTADGMCAELKAQQANDNSFVHETTMSGLGPKSFKVDGGVPSRPTTFCFTTVGDDKRVKRTTTTLPLEKRKVSRKHPSVLMQRRADKTMGDCMREAAGGLKMNASNPFIPARFSNNRVAARRFLNERIQMCQFFLCCWVDFFNTFKSVRSRRGRLESKSKLVHVKLSFYFWLYVSSFKEHSVQLRWEALLCGLVNRKRRKNQWTSLAERLNCGAFQLLPRMTCPRDMHRFSFEVTLANECQSTGLVQFARTAKHLGYCE